MTPFEIALGSALFSCSLVAGLLFAFAIVVMPGLANLDDRDFLHTFQAIDGVIQNNQPLFLAAWVGSVLSLAAAVGLGISESTGVDRLLLIAAAVAYIVGVQVPTMTINVPLNNRLKKLDLDKMDEASRRGARSGFEPRWNRWNAFRTIAASVTVVLLIVLAVGT